MRGGMPTFKAALRFPLLFVTDIHKVLQSTPSTTQNFSRSKFEALISQGLVSFQPDKKYEAFSFSVQPAL
jgi:hypothetical protein